MAKNSCSHLFIDKTSHDGTETQLCHSGLTILCSNPHFIYWLASAEHLWNFLFPNCWAHFPLCNVKFTNWEITPYQRSGNKGNTKLKLYSLNKKQTSVFSLKSLSYFTVSHSNMPTLSTHLYKVGKTHPYSECSVIVAVATTDHNCLPLENYHEHKYTHQGIDSCES